MSRRATQIGAVPTIDLANGGAAGQAHFACDLRCDGVRSGDRRTTCFRITDQGAGRPEKIVGSAIILLKEGASRPDLPCVPAPVGNDFSIEPRPDHGGESPLVPARSHDGLAALVNNGPPKDPYSGALPVFQSLKAVRVDVHLPGRQRIGDGLQAIEEHTADHQSPGHIPPSSRRFAAVM